MRRCVFLDRDGVINVKAKPGEYIRTWAEFQLIVPVVDWIRLFNALDLIVIVVTNQRGVARGLMTQEELDCLHRRMKAALASQNARIDDIFACVHEEGTCDCRKPRDGMVRQAAEKWNIDIGSSILVGDSDLDAELARKCGMRFIRVAEGRILAVL